MTIVNGCQAIANPVWGYSIFNKVLMSMGSHSPFKAGQQSAEQHTVPVQMENNERTHKESNDNCLETLQLPISLQTPNGVFLMDKQIPCLTT